MLPSGCPPLLAEPSDPTLEASVHEAADGSALVRLRCQAAGPHKVSILDAATREPVPGGDFSFDVLPAAVDPGRCSASIPRDGARAHAGDPLVVTAELRDTYGNAVRKPKAGGESFLSVRLVSCSYLCSGAPGL